MRCDEVTVLLPSLVDGVDEANAVAQTPRRHVPAVPGRARALPQTRPHARADGTRYIEPTPGLLGETLAALGDAAEKGALTRLHHEPPSRLRRRRGCRDCGDRGGDGGPDHRPLAPARRVDRASQRASALTSSMIAGSSVKMDMCPCSGRNLRSALGTLSAIHRPCAIGTFSSSSPCQTTTGD